MKAYILNVYTRIGDRVVMQMNPDSRECGPKNQTPDGTIGTIVGYHRYQIYRGRNHGIFNTKPGLYEGNEATIVRWDTGKAEHVSDSYICPVDQSILDSRNNDMDYRNAFETMVYLEKLPLTPYYEGDTIQLNDADVGFWHDKLARILSIDYSRLKEVCIDDVTPYPIYQIESINGNSGTTAVNYNDIEALISRGNYWLLERNEPLVFNNIQEKITFYASIGECLEVKHPIKKNYKWTIEEAVEAIRDKTIAYVTMRNGFFSAGLSLAAYTIPNHPEVEEEVRAAFDQDSFIKREQNG
jgi:hypothetical protein